MPQARVRSHTEPRNFAPRIGTEARARKAAEARAPAAPLRVSRARARGCVKVRRKKKSIRFFDGSVTRYIRDLRYFFIGDTADIEPIIR